MGAVKSMAGTILTISVIAVSGPAAARFVSVDPVQANANNGQNFNRYWYANNNPYKFTDPDGRQVSINYNKPGTPEYRFAQKYQNRPGEISVSGHGSKDHITDDRNRVDNTQEGRVRLDAQGVADAVQSLPEYSQESTVTLLNCNAANGENSIAEQVSNITGNQTQGSPALLEGNPNNGAATPFTDSNGNHARDSGEATQMRTFDPQVQEQDPVEREEQ